MKVGERTHLLEHDLVSFCPFSLPARAEVLESGFVTRQTRNHRHELGIFGHMFGRQRQLGQDETIRIVCFDSDGLGQS